MYLLVLLTASCLLLPAAALNCSSSCMEEMARIRLEDIKSRLLLSMGMTEPLDMTEVSLPASVIGANFESIIRTFDAEENDEDVTYIAAVDPSKGLDRSTLVSHFPMSLQTKLRPVSKAQLTVFLRVDEELDMNYDVLVSVRERYLDGTLGDEVASKTVSISRSSRVVINLQPFDFARWSQDPILGLYVEAMMDGENIAIHPQQSMHKDENMVLTMQLEKAGGRHRRSEEVCAPDSTEKGCCLHDLMVDFKKLGWKFILAPEKYNAFMCRGDCRLNHHHLTRYGHTKVIREGTHKDHNGQPIEMSTCCHPSDYESVKVMYVNNDHQVTVTRVPGMIARRCTCT